MSGTGVPFGSAEGEAEVWLATHAARVAPLLREANLAEWEAATGGGDEAAERVARARLAVRELYADQAEAEQLRGWLAEAELDGPLIRRQLQIVEREYTANALPRATLADLTARAAALEQTFHTFRGRVNGEPLSDNTLRALLRDEPDGDRRRAAWEASKQIGREVAGPLRELVRRRNAAAREVGFADFYTLQLHLQELDEEWLFAQLGEFRDATEAAFGELRREQDRALAARFGVPTEQLRPWHWADPFAQEAPPSAATGLDHCFADRDPVEIAARFFREMGLPVEATLARSDLHERAGKDQHAFCMDVDREGDVRVLCNLRPTERWMGTLLHELGHAAYDEGIDRDLPWLLRTPAHTLVTEAVAMWMGRLTRDPRWLREAAGAELVDAEAAAVRAELRAAMLVATRWMLVMIHFERELYRDPNRADLNGLWWELVERLQGIRRPEGRHEPDWAAKIHLSAAPVYYHNYLLGEWATSQLVAAFERSGDGEWGSIGSFLGERVFAPGATLPWDELLVRATGAPLSPRSFVEHFVSG